MARWEKLKRGTILTTLSAVASSGESANPQRVVDQRGLQLMVELGLIAKYASDLSLKCSELPLDDRLGRSQLLAEFHSAVAQFFKTRALLEQTLPSRRQQSTTNYPAVGSHL
jgi:hypothetical protein